MPMKKGMTASSCLKETQYPSKILDHCKWPPEIMMVPLNYKAASATLK